MTPAMIISKSGFVYPSYDVAKNHIVAHNPVLQIHRRFLFDTSDIPSGRVLEELTATLLTHWTEDGMAAPGCDEDLRPAQSVWHARSFLTDAGEEREPYSVQSGKVIDTIKYDETDPKKGKFEITEGHLFIPSFSAAVHHTLASEPATLTRPVPLEALLSFMDGSVNAIERVERLQLRPRKREDFLHKVREAMTTYAGYYASLVSVESEFQIEDPERMVNQVQAAGVEALLADSGGAPVAVRQTRIEDLRNLMNATYRRINATLDAYFNASFTLPLPLLLTSEVATRNAWEVVGNDSTIEDLPAIRAAMARSFAARLDDQFNSLLY